jgi:pyruvate/2-oxoglutarate dehydrogenase complex dihydrolipoamide acyltransferase (E2) component
MILSIELPRMGDLMTAGTIEKLYIAEGSEVVPGSRLFDVRVDLSAVAFQDCPPIYNFRTVAREKGRITQLCVAVGDLKAVGDQLALLSTSSEDPTDVPPQRKLRTISAAIVGSSF